MATDTRLWMLRAGPGLDSELRLLEKALADLASRNIEPLMPANTHLRLTANVNAALGLLKGRSTGYHKDLQEDKALLFETLDTLMMLLPMVRETIAGTGPPGRGGRVVAGPTATECPGDRAPGVRQRRRQRAGSGRPAPDQSRSLRGGAESSRRHVQHAVLEQLRRAREAIGG